MSAPLNSDVNLIEMFDSYSKAIIRNKFYDLLRMNKNSDLELKSEKIQYLFEQQGYEDKYPSDSFSLEGIGGYRCSIKDERLYQAMSTLSVTKRTMLIMHYWYTMTDVEVARYFGVTTRTIFNWRKNAFKVIRQHYERGSP